MAGSYDMVTKDNGMFNDENFTELIENLGDAHEACEMMHWMIDYLACRHSKSDTGVAILIEEAQQAYYLAKK